jgi:tRNA U34 5-methylaminomethyl-2-thiouridine-forming methyltransferase MnmC
MLSGGTVEVEVGDQPSEAEFAAGFAINLRAEIGQHQNAITECQRKINELLAIEHKPDAQPDDQRMTEHAEAMRRAAEKFEPQT